MFSKIVIFGAILTLSQAGLLGQRGYNGNPLAAGALYGSAALNPAAANLGGWTPGNLGNGSPLSGANLWNPAQNPALAGPLGYSSPVAGAGALNNGWPSPNSASGFPFGSGSPLGLASPFGHRALPQSVPLGYTSPLAHGSPLSGASPLAHGSPLGHGSPLARSPLAGASSLGYAGQPQTSSIAYTIHHNRPAPYNGPLASVGPLGAPGALGAAGHLAHGAALGVGSPLAHGAAYGAAGPYAHAAGPLAHGGAPGAIAPLAHPGAFGPAGHLAHGGALGPAGHVYSGAHGAAGLVHPGALGHAGIAHAGALNAAGAHGNIAPVAQAALAQGGYASGYASAENYNSYPKYQFSYSVEDNLTRDHKAQHEERDGDVVKGEYSLLQPDGSISKVSYSADDRSGFNAVVENNGPNLAYTSRVHH